MNQSTITSLLLFSNCQETLMNQLCIKINELFSQWMIDTHWLNT